MNSILYHFCNIQGWKCAYCGCDLHDNAPHIEHVTPQWTKLPSEIVAACYRCNAIKGKRVFHSISEAREFVLAERKRLQLDITVVTPDGSVQVLPNY